MAIGGFTAISWYNVLELNISIFMTFKRRRGLYFWSILISSWGIILHSLSILLKLYGVVTSYIITCTIITIGWYAMVTGQSLVLYSRLHLVVKEPRILRCVLCMIIFDAIALHIPTTVLTYGSNSPNPGPFSYGYSIMERVQMTLFCVQEYIISGIYVWATVRLLGGGYKKRTRSVMMQLLWINISIMGMDVAMLVMEYLQQYAMETVMKGTIYSVKLKLEFAVLNQLMRLANSSRNQDLHEENRYTGSTRKSSQSTGVFGFFRRILPFHDESTSATSPRPNIGGNGHSQSAQEVTSFGSKIGSDMHDSRPSCGSKPREGITLTTELTQTVSQDSAWRIDCQYSQTQGRRVSLTEEQMMQGQTLERNIYNNPAAFFPPKPICRDDFESDNDDDFHNYYARKNDPEANELSILSPSRTRMGRSEMKGAEISPSFANPHAVIQTRHIESIESPAAASVFHSPRRSVQIGLKEDEEELMNPSGGKQSVTHEKQEA